MSSTYGDKIKISVFGESHGNGIGVVIDGLPAGFEQTIPTSFPAISCPLYGQLRIADFRLKSIQLRRATYWGKLYL